MVLFGQFFRNQGVISALPGAIFRSLGSLSGGFVFSRLLPDFVDVLCRTQTSQTRALALEGYQAISLLANKAM